MTQRQQNDELYPAVVAGDEAACERMIVDNIPLVYVMVGDYLKENPHLRYLKEDLIAEGQARVVMAIRSMGQVCNPNATGRIRKCISSGFAQVVRTYSVATTDLPSYVFSDQSTPEVLLADLRQLCYQLGIPWAVVQMRIEGYTDREIENEIGCSRRRVSDYRKQLRELHENS